MANVLKMILGVLLNVVLFVMTKTMMFFWRLLASTSASAGFHRTPGIDIVRYERDSEDFTSIRLSRYETPDQIFIYGHFLDENSKTLLKGLLHQVKTPGAKTNTYLYAKDEHNPDIIQAVQIRFPITINFLDSVFKQRQN